MKLSHKILCRLGCLPVKAFGLLSIASLMGCTNSNFPQPIVVADKAVFSDCTDQVKVLSAVGLDKVKEGLDGVVKQIPASVAQEMIYATQVYRRSSGDSYSDSEIMDAQAQGIDALNQIGSLYLSQGLVTTAPKITEAASAGVHFKRQRAYPQAPANRKSSNLTQSQIYDGVPVFGVTEGERLSNLGYAAFGEVTTRMNNINYTLDLVYSAAASRYILTLSAYKDGQTPSETLLNSCASDSQIRNWTELPVATTNVSEQCGQADCKGTHRD